MSVIEELKRLNLVSGVGVEKIFSDYYTDVLECPISSWHEYMKMLWERERGDTGTLSGNLFECFIACALYRAGVLPFYVQAKVAFIPNVSFDFIAYSKECGPVVLSAKTSLRERYKQADLEGMMLRQVHRRSESYLLTMDPTAINVNAKIDRGEVLGLDKVINVLTPDFDELIEAMKLMNFYKPEKIEIISSSKIVE